MEILREVRGDIPIYRTNCCALVQLSLNNSNTLDEIEEIIESMKKQSKEEMNSHAQCNYLGNERAAFVITLDHENKLVENLQKLGFKEIAEFHRRICYPENSMLKMWLLSW